MTDAQKAMIDRFEQVINSYGANPDRWPEGEREGLLALLKTHPHLRAFVQMEAAVDEYLTQDLADLHASGALTARLQQEAMRLHGPSSFWKDLFGAGLFRPAAGLMTAALLGIMIGWYSPTILPDDDISFDELAISDSLLEWEQENDNG